MELLFYETVSYIEEHFEEEKEKLSEKLIDLSKKLFCGDNMMLSYTAAREGLEGLEEMVEKLKTAFIPERKKKINAV